MRGSEKKVLLAAIILILVAGTITGIIAVTPKNKGENHSLPAENRSQTAGESVAAPPRCEAGWSKGIIVASDPDLGIIYYVVPNGNGTVTVYKTFLYFLTEKGILPANESISGMKENLANKTILPFLEEQANKGFPTVVKAVTTPSRGYEILLPTGKPPQCLKPALETLYPGQDKNITVKYLGYSRIPYLALSWSYYNVSLPAWSVAIHGKNVSVIWIDPQRGLLVAEQDRFGLHLWSMIVVPFQEATGSTSK